MAANPSTYLSSISSRQLPDSAVHTDTEQTEGDYLDHNVWNRIFPQYSFAQLICQTENSLVWLGCQKLTLQRVALKITQKIQKGSSVLLHQQRQKAFVTQNQFKHMVQTIQVKETGLYRLLVMEYYPWSLADLLAYYTKNSQQRYTSQHLNFIVYAFTGILNAVLELHSLGYIHRDLKLDNFMIDKNFNICLNDFELVTKQLVIDSSLSGTLEYMAPQRLSKKRMSQPITREVDIWSLGIILYQLFTGQTPYNGQSPQQVLDEIYQEYIKAKLIPQQEMSLIRQMLQIRSDKRISIQQIRKSSFLKREVDLDLVKVTITP